jgi:hypothetical protein
MDDVAYEYPPPGSHQSVRVDVLTPERHGIHHCRPTIGPGRIEDNFLPQHVPRIVPADARGKRQELPKCDRGLPRVRERKRLRGKESGCKNLLVQPVGKQLWSFVDQNAERETREALPDRREVCGCFAMPSAEIFFIDEPAVAHDQQAAVLRGPLNEFESFIQLC